MVEKINFSNSPFVNMVGGGYFPKEIPPTFSTRTFGECARRHDTKNCILDTADQKWRQYEIHNLARAGTLRRELALVNPVSYWHLAREISKNWDALKKAAESSQLSITRPITSLPRALPWGRDIHAARAQVRSQGKYVLIADISNFFGSIYTHTIPWALHTKRQTRLNLKDKNLPPLLGDTLDKLLRAMQDGQSVGLPVGPDTSLLLAEIILSNIDDTVLSHCVDKGYRFVDDYELVFNSEGEALETRNKLQSALADYRLSLNPLKTKIVKLPIPLDNGWSRELWRIIARKSILRKTDIIDFFDRAFDLAQMNPAAGVLKFALGKLCKKMFAADAVDITHNLVLQCARVEPGCLPFVMAIILRPGAKDPKWLKKISATLHSTVHEHAPQRHSNEVAWALWGALALDIEISKDAAVEALRMEDSICSLLLFHSYKNGTLPGIEHEVKNWKSNLGEEDLFGPRWLLAYELARLKFTTDATGKNYVSNDKCFGFLLEENVAFFDDNKFDVPTGLIPSIETDSDEEEPDEDDDWVEKNEEYSLGGFWEEWNDWEDLNDDDEKAFDAFMRRLSETNSTKK